MGNRVTADVTEYDDAWTHIAYARRQWGLVADQRPSTPRRRQRGVRRLGGQDFDGISYARARKSILGKPARCSATRCSSRAPSTTSRRTGSATPPCTTCSRQEKAGAGDLSSFTGNWLRTAGSDTIVLDRAGRRTAPHGRPPGRPRPHGSPPRRRWEQWEVSTLQVQGAGRRTPPTVRRSSSTRTRTAGRSSSRTRPRRR